MSDTQLLLGIVLMILGVALTVAAVFRALRDQWTWGVHELWVIPLGGVVLMLTGRWLIE